MGKAKRANRTLNQGLTLLVNNPGSADPVLPIAWCVAPQTLETIAKQRILNPQLLIIVAEMVQNWRYNNEEQTVYSFKEVYRQLVPLKQGLEYVNIKRAGKFRIFATIVGGQNKTIQDLEEQFFGYCRDINIVTRNGEFIPPKPSLRRASLDVEVGKEFFAHEPAEWEKNWVNKWYSEPAKDQCQFRRRRFVAYSIQPMVMLVAYLAIALVQLLVGVFLLAGGLRKINWKAAYQPWLVGSKAVFDKVEFDDSIFFVSPNQKTTRWYLFAACPYWSMAILVFAVVINLHHLSWLWVFWFFVKAYLCIYVIGTLALYCLGKIIESKAALSEEELHAKHKAKLEARAAALLLKNQEEIAYLQCGNMPAVPSVSALPHPPFRLRYLALKAKVCRPFAR